MRRTGKPCFCSVPSQNTCRRARIRPSDPAAPHPQLRTVHLAPSLRTPGARAGALSSHGRKGSVTAASRTRRAAGSRVPCCCWWRYPRAQAHAQPFPSTRGSGSRSDPTCTCQLALAILPVQPQLPALLRPPSHCQEGPAEGPRAPSTPIPAKRGNRPRDLVPQVRAGVPCPALREPPREGERGRLTCITASAPVCPRGEAARTHAHQQTPPAFQEFLESSHFTFSNENSGKRDLSPGTGGNPSALQPHFHISAGKC